MEKTEEKFMEMVSATSERYDDALRRLARGEEPEAVESKQSHEEETSQ